MTQDPVSRSRENFSKCLVSHHDTRKQERCSLHKGEHRCEIYRNIATQWSEKCTTRWKSIGRRLYHSIPRHGTEYSNEVPCSADI